MANARKNRAKAGTWDGSAGPAELQRILDSVLDGIVVVSAAGLVEQINDEASRILETSSDHAPGHPIADLVDEAGPIAQLVAEVQKSRQSVTRSGVELQRRFGSKVEGEVVVSPMAEDSSRPAGGVVVLLRDRTVGNSLREEESQRERLDSYGYIAAGIAHEVKNPLSGIRGAAELLGLRAGDERSKRTAELIVNEVDRITELVDRLMVFATGDELQLAPLNLHQMLDRVLELSAVDPQAANVYFDRVFDPSIPDIVGDEDRLIQVFLNLARNAIQSMGDEGGTLRITTRMLLQGRVIGANGRPKPTVEITVEDDGPGIPEKLRDRLTTPFFTTKTDGTGLGLPISRHWVTQHGGQLRIASGEESGARVRVALPLVSTPARRHEEGDPGGI
jgi:two-component system nitrogen regulation sensor histidine kinase GlnL